MLKETRSRCCVNAPEATSSHIITVAQIQSCGCRATIENASNTYINTQCRITWTERSLELRSFPTAYMRVTEPLIMTRPPGLRLSVVPQLHLSAPPSHFKSRKLIEPFFISPENETGGEKVAESAEEPLLWLHSSSPDNPATRRNDNAIFPKHIPHLPPPARTHAHTPTLSLDSSFPAGSTPPLIHFLYITS